MGALCAGIYSATCALEISRGSATRPLTFAENNLASIFK
jgi:hypothetical protein